MRLLLDANLSPELAAALRGLGIDAECVRDWRNGELLNADDDQILFAAFEAQRIVVTADFDSISRLAREWADAHQTHHGIIFLGNQDRRRSSIGRVSQRIARLLDDLADSEWRNRTVYLPPPEQP